MPVTHYPVTQNYIQD